MRPTFSPRSSVPCATGHPPPPVAQAAWLACCAARFRSLGRGSMSAFKRGGDDRNERCPTPVSHAKTDIVGERGSTCDVIQWGRGRRNKIREPQCESRRSRPTRKIARPPHGGCSKSCLKHLQSTSPSAGSRRVCTGVHSARSCYVLGCWR